MLQLLCQVCYLIKGAREFCVLMSCALSKSELLDLHHLDLSLHVFSGWMP